MKKHLNMIILLGAGIFILICAVLMMPKLPKPTELAPIFRTAEHALVYENDRALIDINKADRALLLTLPGIGESLTEAIIAHRETNGEFAHIDALLDVSGIGNSKLEAMKPHIICPTPTPALP